MSIDKIEEMEEISNPDYSKGFNSGFLIGKHEPKVSDKLLVSLNETMQDNEPPYLEGLRDGMLVYELEKIRERHSPDKNSPDKEKDKDIEPIK